MFDAFFTGIAWLLNFFYELVPNYAIAIGLLTLTVMLVTTPITLKGTRSMLQLQALQPEMRRIQQKYRDDPQKRNEETMRFYKENNVNPLGGCLPTLLQLPIFFILFQVLQGLTKTGEDGTFDPKYLDHSSELYKALDGSTEMLAFGIDLSESASEALGQGFGTALPYLLLIAMVGRVVVLPAAPDAAPDAGLGGVEPGGQHHEVHAAHHGRDLLHLPGRLGHLLRRLEPLPDRPAGLHHQDPLLPSRLPRQEGAASGREVREEKEAEGDTGPTSFKRPVKSTNPKPKSTNPKPGSTPKPKPTAAGGSGQNRNRSGSNPNGAGRNGGAKQTPASHPRSKKKRKRR